MTDSNRAETDIQWALGAQISLGDGMPSLELLRPLSPAELERVEQATELLNRLSAVAEFARVIGLMEAVEERHDALADRDRPPPMAALGPLTETIAALCAALSDVPAALVDQARQDLPLVGSDALAQQIAALTASDTWRLVLALPSVLVDRRANLTIDERALRLSAGGLDALSRSAGVGDPPNEPVLALLREALLLAEDMVGHRLLAYRDLIDERGLAVRVLAAEVPLGMPTLLAITRLEPTADEERQNVSMKPLPLDRSAILQTAIRNAQRALDNQPRADDGNGGGHGDQSAGEQPDDDHDADDVQHDEDNSARDDGGDLSSDLDAIGGPDGGTTDLSERGDDSSDDAIEDDSPDLDVAGLAPIDEHLLFEHARALPSEAERAWSAALSSLGQDDAHAELAARWQALMTALARRAQEQANELSAAGIDARIKHPDDPAALSVLTLDHDSRARWLAASIGQMTGFQAMVEAYGRVLHGRRDARELGEPDTPRWWTSGGFNALRAQAASVERLTDEVGAAEARLLAGDDPSAVVPVGGSWTERLRLADDAQGRGDWEAAVVHLWLALRERAAQLASTAPASIPEAFEERLAADPEVGGYGQGLPLLAGVARLILAGDPPPLGYSAVLAHLLTPRIRQLCASLSDVLPRAVAEPDTIHDA